MKRHKVYFLVVVNSWCRQSQTLHDDDGRVTLFTKNTTLEKQRADNARPLLECLKYVNLFCGAGAGLRSCADYIWQGLFLFS